VTDEFVVRENIMGKTFAILLALGAVPIASAPAFAQCAGQIPASQGTTATTAAPTQLQPSEIEEQQIEQQQQAAQQQPPGG
jgi:hypothetical protein